MTRFSFENFGQFKYRVARQFIPDIFTVGYFGIDLLDIDVLGIDLLDIGTFNIF